jgi:hypothetical protein
MNKYLSPLKFKDFITLTGLIIIGFGWLLADQIFLHQVSQRFVAFFILILTLYYFQFIINKPENAIRYANSISLITVTFIVIISVVMHIVIQNDFTYRSVMIWIVTGSLPYFAAFLYQKTRKKQGG